MFRMCQRMVPTHHAKWQPIERVCVYRTENLYILFGICPILFRQSDPIMWKVPFTILWHLNSTYVRSNVILEKLYEYAVFRQCWFYVSVGGPLLSLGNFLRGGGGELHENRKMVISFIK